ncbi:hypothetical protein [Marinicellulosiphila megalodicopiae]|uniref:hypothetical protein n=1 Tax=Marinicellulosiphila megalodicopiae TaxID=2724896 RepID=UPI003BB1CED4
MRYNPVTKIKKTILTIAAICLAFPLSANAQNHDLQFFQLGHSNKSGYLTCCNHALKSLVGKKVVLQIDSIESDEPQLFPNKGVIVQTYLDNKQYDVSHFDQEYLNVGVIQYHYRRVLFNLAVERGVDQQGIKFKTKLNFDSKQSGTWVRTYFDNQTVLKGHFLIEDSQKDLIAPTQVNRTQALTVLHSASDVVPEGGYPSKGSIILQQYQDEGLYNGVAFGPGTVVPKGIYNIQKISNNVVVENAIQTIDELNFSAPYTMVYFYETPYSGQWYQNFADGLIIFSGTFTNFDTP